MFTILSFPGRLKAQCHAYLAAKSDIIWSLSTHSKYLLLLFFMHKELTNNLCEKNMNPYIVPISLEIQSIKYIKGYINELILLFL